MIFKLVHDQARQGAIQAVKDAPSGWVVRVTEPTRSLEANAKFHALCGEFEKLGIVWFGKKRTAKEWKVLLVSGHAIATNEGSDVVMGLEGELVNIRESTALMSVKRSSSLIDYSIAFYEENK